MSFAMTDAESRRTEMQAIRATSCASVGTDNETHKLHGGVDHQRLQKVWDVFGDRFALEYQRSCYRDPTHQSRLSQGSLKARLARGRISVTANLTENPWPMKNDHVVEDL